MTTKSAGELSAGDTVVERDGCLLTVATVERFGGLVRIRFAPEDICPVTKSLVLKATRAVRVADVA